MFGDILVRGSTSEMQESGPCGVWRKVIAMGFHNWDHQQGLLLQTATAAGRDPTDVVSSEMYLVLGLKDWAQGMKGAVASVVMSFSAQAGPECQAAVAECFAAERSGMPMPYIKISKYDPRN